MTQVQTLASGVTPTTRYGGLGGYSGKMKSPPSRIKAFIFGLPGEGKSALLQDCPDAFIFNLDLTSTTAREPRATLFPGIDPESGNPMGDGGRHVVLTWDPIAEKIDLLRKLSVENKPRPKIVCFDSLTAWCQILRVWIPRNAKKLGLTAKDAPDVPYEWKDLHGPAAYDTMYDIVVRTITDLSAHGYGVYVIGHVVNAKIPLGENQYVFKPDLIVGDGLWKRIYNIFELSAIVSAETVTESYFEEQASTIRGVSSVSKVRKERTTRQHLMSVARLDLAGIAKARVKLPDRIILPYDHPWDAFEKAYLDAVALA